MGVELLEIGVKVKKVLIFTIRGCFRSVYNHPFLVGMLCFLILLYRLSPFVFHLLVSASPVLVCTAVLLGTLLSFGQPNIPEIEIEEKATVEAVELKSGVLEKNESYYVERFSDLSVGEVRREDSDDTAPLIEERSRTNEVNDGESWDDLGFKKKNEWIEERLDNWEVVESHNYGSDVKVNDEVVESDDEKSEADSFDSEKVNVDSLDSPPPSPWTRIEERENKAKEVEEDDEEEDEDGSDSESGRAESSSPDASMADIMPMLDELHPLLDEEVAQTVHVGSDAASEKSRKSIGHESDDEAENHEDLEVADDENEDEEDVQEDKEQIKSAITWTEEDQKNLMDLGTSEIERNIRLENLILRRRARKNMGVFPERNLIDLESSDLPFNIPPISTRRQNPFDLSHDYYDNSGLPPIPGSAPSVLLPRRNPFDIPYDSSEEKPDLMGDGFKEEFTTSQSREVLFRRHESFNVGPSIFAPRRMRPYFVPEGTVSEESTSSLFQRQSSELSDSKVSSIPEMESNVSVEDLNNLPEEEVIVQSKEVDEEGPEHEVNNEENVNREPEMLSQMESVSEHVGHGSRSSVEEDTLELGQVEKRDFEISELELDHHEQGRLTKYVEVEQRYGSDSSSSSLSEVGERIFTETEGEGLFILEERTDGVAEAPSISTQTSVETTDLNIASTLVNNIPQRGPVYDSSPRELSKNVSLSSISSDVHPEFDLGSLPVSLIGRDSEGSNTEMLPDSLNVRLVDESRPTDVDIRVHDNIHIGFPGVDQISTGEVSLEEHLVEQHIRDEVPVSIADKNIHNMVEFSEDRNLEQAHSLIEVNEPPFEGQLGEEYSVCTDETVQSPNSDADVRHEADEKLISTPSAEGNVSLIYDEAKHEPNSKNLDEVLPSSTAVESFVQGQVTEKTDMPEVQELDCYISSNVNSPSSLGFISISPSVIETTSSHVGVQKIVEEADEIKEIDEVLLSELDNVGDFSIGTLGSGSSEYGKHTDSVGESSSLAHHAETSTTRVIEINSNEASKIENALCSENSRELINIYEEDDELSSVLQTSDTIRDENTKVSRMEFNESGDEDSSYQETSGNDTLPKENKVQPVHSLVNHNYEDTVSSLPESKVQPLEDADVVPKKAEPTYVETEIMVGSADVSYQGQVSTIEDIDLAFNQISSKATEKPVLFDPRQTELHNYEDTVSGVPETEVQPVEDVDAVPEKDELKFGATYTTSGMPELEASTIEDIDLAFKQISSQEIEKPVVFEPLQAELHSHEDTVSGIIPESEVRLVEDVDAVPDKAESTSVETEMMVGGSEVSCQGRVDMGTASEILELEASTIEDIDLAFKQISSEDIEKPVVVEPPQAEMHNHEDTNSGMPELEASTIEDIDLAFKQLTSKEIEKPIVLEPSQAGLVVQETITQTSEDGALHSGSSMTIPTHEKSVLEEEPIKDATLDDKQLAAQRSLHVVESGETQGAFSEQHVAKLVPSDVTILPPMHDVDGKTKQQPNLNSNDGSAEDKTAKVGSSEELSVKEPEHQVEAPKDLHSPSSVKGKGKISKSSSSSSSSSSESSSSDSDRD